MTVRKSDLTLIYKVGRQTNENTANAVKRLLGSKSNQVHTITSDNGKEFGNHEKIAAGLKCDFYFAQPYSSWERGTNEKTNGLIRQYFSKNRVFRTITDNEIIHAMKRLNNRPICPTMSFRRGKRHGHKTLKSFWHGVNCCTY
jgi:transposase, IS30 family